MSGDIEVEDVGSEVVEEAYSDSEWDDIEETAPSMDEDENDEESEIEAKGDEVESDDVKDESDDIKASSKDDEDDSEDSEESEEDSEEAKSLNLDDLDENATLTIKVDGEMEEISIKDYKSGISGQKALARKWSEVNNVHQQNQKDIKDVNEYVNTFSEKMKEGNTLEAMAYLGSFSGMGQHQIKASLIKSLMPEIERMGLLSQSEIDLEYQKQESAHITEQRERDNVQNSQRQAQENLNQIVSDTKSQHSIEDTEWDDAISYLDKHLDAGEAITPELVTEYVQYERASVQAESLLTAVEGENLFTDTNMDVLQKIILDNPEFTEADLKEVVQEGMRIAKEQAVEEKAEVSNKKIEKRAKSKKTNNNDSQFAPLQDEYGDEITDFDQL